MVPVYDMQTGEALSVPAVEAAAGMVRYARRYLGAGTPAAGHVERQALDLLRTSLRERNES
jgi:hypothetical protein